MSTLPPVADPTASMPPPSSGVSSVPPAPTASSTLAPIAAPPPRAPVVMATTKQGRPASSTTTTTTKTSSKSKKKQSVTMATATSAGGSGGSSGENTGRWTAEEHNLFLQGLELHGKGWKKIAGLIKSRTVVQIRTHAQKYFQKLAKAKQNGEDVSMAGGNGSNNGAVNGSTMTMMMGDGGRSSLTGAGGAGGNGAGVGLSSASAAGVGHAAAHSSKRRKQTSGTKRKAIQSVVASARRQGNKKLASRKKSPKYEHAKNGTGIAPALVPYVLPTPLSQMNIQPTTSTNSSSEQGAVGVTALEDSLFRFLTPAPVLPPDTQVTPVARQAGANPITLPTTQPGAPSTLSGGEISPTGVNELELYPTWTDYNKEAPSWYAKGSDVDALLDVADTLEWLTDTGDLNEAYEEVKRMDATVPDASDVQPTPYQMSESHPPKDVRSTIDSGTFYASTTNTTTMSMNTLPRIDSAPEVNVPPLPPLFDGDGVTDAGDDPSGSKTKLSLHMSSVPSVSNLDEHLFSSSIEEHEFVSTILDESGNGSSVSLAGLATTP